MATPTLENVRLIRTGDGTWTAGDGRFTVVRIPARRGEPLAYDITDTARRDWVNYPGQGNVVRVYELGDARYMIGKAVRDTPRRSRRPSF